MAGKKRGRTSSRRTEVTKSVVIRSSFGLTPRYLLILTATIIILYIFYSLSYATYDGLNLFDILVIILYTNIPFFYVSYGVVLTLFVLWSESMLPEGIKRHIWYPLTALGWIFIVMGFWNVDFTMEKYHPEISLEPMFTIGNFTFTYWDLYTMWWSLTSIGLVICVVGLFNYFKTKRPHRKSFWLYIVVIGAICTLLGFHIVNVVFNLPPTHPESRVWVGHDPFGHQAFSLSSAVFIKWNISLTGLGALTVLIASFLATREIVLRRSEKS